MIMSVRLLVNSVTARWLSGSGSTGEGGAAPEPPAPATPCPPPMFTSQLILFI